MLKLAMMPLLCGCVLLVDAPISNGQEPDVDCSNATTQTDMTICARERYAEADDALNTQYRITRDAMRRRDADDIPENKGAEDALVKAQRAWIAYRDAQCVSVGFQARGGSMEPMLVANCQAEMTLNRAEELHKIAQGLEN
ncbi:lysozyme inhibitor LprI family protein [Neorhizobium sp. NPDC001467]|uniref:lysozyme inhibitor LprI family protein n=1 Tax=Neorhizobium sp. NPDC001467 TaxID=3390595 RepID=UPI003CFBE214